MTRINRGIVRRAGSVAAALCMAALTLLLPLSGTPAKAAATINNASLIPKIVPDSQVKLEDGSPDWVKSLIMAEVRLETATKEGTFQAATKLLDHYAEMGVNALWITPPYADTAVYGAKYPDRLASKLTGTTDVEKGFAVAKAFVNEAHKRNIRIFFDIVTWGTTKDCPLVTEHPDWYDNWREAYGGYVWKWSNKEWQKWFINNAVNIVEKTGIDGYRCDLEPDNTGYDIFDQVRQRLLKKGKKIAIFSEIVNYRYGSTGNLVYDFEQVGVGSDESCQYHYINYENYFTERGNIVDCVKSGIGIGTKTLQPSGEGGTFRYYTFCLTCHDSSKTHGKGSRINFGYQMVFAPFIPLWYIGEEWINPKKTTGTGVLFYNNIDWSLLDQPENRAFYEDVKKMIRIRRQYPDIFTYFPENHQETNICKVSVKGIEDLGAYARYSGSNGILVVPNANVHDKSGKFEIIIPLAEMGLDNCKKFTVTELMTGKTVVSGTKDQVRKFSYTVPSQEMGIFLVKGEGAPATTTTKNSSTTTTRKRPSPATTAPAAASADTTDSSTNDPASTAVSTAPAEETSATADAPDSSTADPTATVPVDASEQSEPDSGAHTGVWIAVGAAAVVLIAGGAAAFILWKKKKAAG